MKSGLSRRQFLASSAALLAAAKFGSAARGQEVGASGGGDLVYFDAFTRIGPRANKHPAEPWTIEALRSELEHCSIAGALVTYTLSVNYDALWSNLELSRMLADYPELYPVWNAMPHATGEFPEPRELARLMREHDVRAVTLSPSTNSWNVFAESSRPLLEWLGRERILTVISRAEFSDFEALDRLLEAYPDIPVLYQGATWSQQRQILPLVERHRNFHISFDHFQIHYGLEYFVSEGREDQLLFASNAPAMSAGAHRTYVDYAAIPQSAKQKIAGGNLKRLLKGQGPDRPRLNGREDVFMRAARMGQPPPAPVLDMHMHVLDQGLHGGGGHYRMLRGDAEGSFELIGRLGFVGGSVMSWNGTVSADSLGGNATIARVLDRAPSGYWGTATFDPVHYSQDELQGLIAERYEDRRFIGMKPYTRYGVEYHHPSWEVWWRYGHERQFFGLLHRTRSDTREVDALAEKYPRIRWLIAHSGSSYRAADQVIECMKRFPNVFAEITYTSVTLGVLEYIAEHAGEDRVVFGTDLSMRDPRQQLGWVLYSRLSPEAKAKALGGNAWEIIGPCLDRLPPHNRPRGF